MIDTIPPRMRRLLRFSLAVAVVAFAAFSAGCGNQVETRTVAATEGPYLDLGDLQYQVQISRYLNVNDVEDATYLSGLPANTAQPTGDETWFGVFMRVRNSTDEALAPANDFEIVDTQDNVYRPIPLDPKVNPFAYVADPIPPQSMLPAEDSIASEGVIKQGALLLFKIKTDSLQNRPLILRFRKGSGTQATVDLDV